MKIKLLSFVVLMCLVGIRAQAQTSPTATYVADNLDFSGYNTSWRNQGWQNQNTSSIEWADGNYLRSFSQGGNWWESPGTRYFTSQVYMGYNNQYRLSVDNTNNFNIAHDGGGENDPSYLQFDASNANNGTERHIYIHLLGVNDKVTVQFAGGTRCYLMSNNTNAGDPGTNGIQLSQNQELTIVNDNNDGVIELRITNEDGNYPGIRFIGIQVYKEVKDPRFDYDPGYEEYDLYDEFTYTGNDPNDQESYNQASTTTQFNTEDAAGFNLNGSPAQYVEFTASKISANNRIAVDQSGTWRFNYGLRPPTDDTNDVWSNFSVCNLRVGDRVVVSYMGGPEDLVFSSAGNSTTYNGCIAFADKWNDGVYNEGEDQYITGGMAVQIDWQRNEGTISGDYGIDTQPEEHQLYYTKAYVIAENGHLDFGIKNGPVNRLVKIKIYSDHQAMMVDDYIKDDYRYTAHFNISGELQMKEHIMPGGLEVHVGNDNPNQHAIVVASKDDENHVNPIDGFVSYVNAVDGYKIPGVTKSNDGEYYVPKFDLAPGNGITSTGESVTYNASMDRLPETGTYYVFKPEAPGTMKLKFKANSMNYYRWDYSGDAVYDRGNWIAQFDRPNEQTLDVTCPYYLVTIAKATDQNPNPTPTFTKLDDVNNGQFFETQEISLEEGYTYYLYGAWNSDDVYFSGPDNGNYVHSQNKGTTGYIADYQNNIEYRPIDGEHEQFRACGVAELLWVDFTPDRSIFPLAKWVPNNTQAVKADKGVPNPDDPTNKDKYEYALADVQGYVNADITVKKMSGNIVSCHPYIWRATPGAQEGKLMIDNIVFAEGKNPGGTILIKIGQPDDKTGPLYTLTVAYSAEEKYDKDKTNAGRGRTWDYSTKSLQGLTWDNETYNSSVPTGGVYSKIFSNTESGYAVVKNLGPYFENYFRDFGSSYSSAADVMENMPKTAVVDGVSASLLREEMDYQDDHGLSRSDWMFNYNLVNNGVLYDPIFVNKYDMEGDNADMVWDSEGMVFQTSSGQSGIFDEYGKDVAHSASEATDPDRFIGIMEGGKFRIPWLMKDDRVIIRMGIGTLNLLGQAKFSIRNAYDALHNEINPEDDYVVGGSQWMGASDPYYGGCYHFFAQGDGQGGPADMVFEMKEGSVCKIYSVQIYRGNRIITNEIVGKTENDNFLPWSTAPDPNDADPDAETQMDGPHTWTLKYFGKDQKLADGQYQTNEVLAQTGKYAVAPALVTSTETDPQNDAYNTFTYSHSAGDIGTFRMRAKDMERNMKYVADYADHNVTVAYQETMSYPYTWDFMDATGYGTNSDNFDAEDAIGSTFDDEYLNSLPDNDYEKTSRNLSLWRKSGLSDGAYALHLNSQEQTMEDLKEIDNIFETAKAIDGNQLWANGDIIPETQGLWFYTNDNNKNHGPWRIHNSGMELNGYANWSHKLVVPNVPENGAVYLRMVSTKETDLKYEFKGGNTNFDTYGPQLVTGTNGTYIFAIRNKGPKRHLTLSLAGYKLEKLAVSTDPKSVNQKGYASESRDHAIDAKLLPYFTDKPLRTYTVTGFKQDAMTVDLNDIALTNNYVVPANTGVVIFNDDTKVPTSDDPVGDLETPFGPFDGGFHLFVPDMHDKTGKFAELTGNLMLPAVGGLTPVPYTNIGVTLDHSGEFDNDNPVWYAWTWSTAEDGVFVKENQGKFFGLKDKVKFLRVNPNNQNVASWDRVNVIWNETGDLDVQQGKIFRLTSWLAGEWVNDPNSSTDMTNYVLSFKYKRLNGNNLSQTIQGPERFYRVYSENPVNLRPNSAYMALPTALVAPGGDLNHPTRVISFRHNNFMRGDVNSDLMVDVADFTGIANHILGRTSETFIERAADVNDDDMIDVADFTGVANIILGKGNGTNRAQMVTDDDDQNDMLYVEPFEAVPGTQQVIAVRMTNYIPATGFEFTLTLPEGMTFATDADGVMARLSTARTSERKTDFFGSALQADGSLKVLCGTSRGDDYGLFTFDGTDGEVALITVNIPADYEQAQYTATVSDGKYSDMFGLSHYFGTTTGISDIAVTFDAEPDTYYTLSGQKLNGRPAQRGFYILNGKKVMVK